MKKFLIIFLCLLAVRASSCSAEIYKTQDEFTNKEEIGSGEYGMKEEDVRYLLFYKIPSGNLYEYMLRVDNSTYKEHVLADNSIEMRVDDLPTYILENKNYKNIGPLEGKILAILTVKVPEEATGKLKDAKRVVLRFTRNNGFQFVYVLPDNVLAEWKQVINAEK